MIGRYKFESRHPKYDSGQLLPNFATWFQEMIFLDSFCWTERGTDNRAKNQYDKILK